MNKVGKRMNQRVAIIIPVYNSEEYLPKCIESVKSQTYTNWELILVDDGSTDASGKICDQYQSTDKRIKVIHQANGGQTAARKSGIKEAESELVIFIDSDDWVDDTYLETLMTAYEEADDENVLIVCDLTYENEYGVIKKPIIKGCFDISKEVLPVYLWHIDRDLSFVNHSLSGKIFRTDLVRQKIVLVREEIKYGEDALLLCHILMELNKVIKIGRAGYHYYQNEASVTHTGRLEMITQLKAALEEYEGMLLPYVNKEEIRKQFGYRIQTIMMRCAANYLGYALRKCFLCPYDMRGKNVVVYGAGIKGTEFVYKNRFLNIKHWVDRNFADITRDIPVENPDNIKNYDKNEYDYILIAIEDRAIQRQVEKYLLKSGVDYDKIWPLEMKIFMEPIEEGYNKC